MQCLELNRAYRDRHGFALASQEPDKVQICAGCGRLMRSQCVSSVWGWWHTNADSQVLCLEDDFVEVTDDLLVPES